MKNIILIYFSTPPLIILFILNVVADRKEGRSGGARLGLPFFREKKAQRNKIFIDY